MSTTIANTYRMQIPPDKVEQTRKFFRERGGVVLWHNQEIGSSPVMRPVMTPATHEDGSPAKPPHWSYGKPEPLQVEDIGVREEEKIEPPLDWFPVCDVCKGKKRYTTDEWLAAFPIPGEKDYSRSKKMLQEHQLYNAADDSIGCYRCWGTGHIDRHIKIAIRKKYWGLDITDTGRKKASKLAKKIGPDVLWTWECTGYGLAEIVFYREKVWPFTLE